MRVNSKDPYGFNIGTLTENGRNVVSSVTPESKADYAGIRTGDFILEVNGVSVETIPHNEIIAKLTSNANLLDLLVVSDIDGYLSGLNVILQKEDAINEKHVAELKKKIPKSLINFDSKIKILFLKMT